MICVETTKGQLCTREHGLTIERDGQPRCWQHRTPREVEAENIVTTLQRTTAVLFEIAAAYGIDTSASHHTDRPTISNADDVTMLLGPEMSCLVQEQLRVLILNNKHQLIGQRTIYVGTVNSASIRVAEILRPAIIENAPAMLIVHNHPSGDATPSPEDILTTKRIKQAADNMDIDLLDHIVIGKRINGVIDYTSMKSRQLGF